MQLPTRGPKVEAHNRMISREQSFWFFISEKTQRVKVSYTGLGPLLLAYTNEKNAERIREQSFSDSFACHLDDIDMAGFFEVIIGNPANKGIKGILLDVPREMIAGDKDFVTNDELLQYVFLAEEMGL